MPTRLALRVLFVITRGDSIGGAQVHVRDLAAGAMARGHIVLVAVGTSGVFLELLERSGVKAILVPGLGRSIHPLADLRAIRALRRRIRDFQPDLVACHTAKAGLVGRVAAWFERVPSQYTVHGWQFAGGIHALQRGLVLLVERLLSFVTSAVITVSDYDRELALRNRLFRPEEITTVHNGMPDNGLRAELGSTPEVRLVMVARFQPQKDHATLFAALEKLADLPWRLDLVGDGPGLAAWSEWVKLHGWSNRVTFHGLIFDVSTVLASSQIFVLASRWEGFPNSILEAMRTGLPVVATDVGGVAEAVKDGITGLLVPVGDASSLAHALTKLIGDSEERRTFGTAGRARFENDFTFEVMLSRTVTVWSRIAKCTSPPSS